MNRKKLLSVCLSIALIVAIIPFSSVKASADTYGPFTYEVNDNEATITNVFGFNYTLDIPDNINGFPVTAIADNAFADATVFEVYFNGTKEQRDNLKIGQGNDNLNYATWNYTDENGQFRYRINGDTVNISGVNYLDGTSLFIPSEIEDLPVTEIYYLNSSGACSMLNDISIPDTITYVSTSAFLGCSLLENIYVDPNNKVYSSYGNCIIRNDTKTLAIGCKNSNIPTDANIVNTIGSSAFASCIGLTTIVIPENITKIDSFAFSSCFSLEKVVLTTSITEIREYAFSGCYNLGKVYYTGLPEDKAVIPVSYGNECLMNAAWIYGYTFGEPLDDVMHSGDYYYFIKNGQATIFDVDDEISGNVTVPNELGYYPVTAIDKGAFSNCSDVTNITIPNGITDIVYLAFENCTGIKSISIPSSVQRIDAGAFVGCSSIDNFDLSEDNEVYHVDGNSLIKTESRTLIAGTSKSVIPDDGSVASIVYFAFGGCSGLKNIDIPSTVTSIGSGSFSDCTGLQSVNLNDGLNSIGDWAFYNCSSLQNISVPDSVVEIGGKAFSGCTSLKTAKLSKNMYSVNDETFLGCTSLSGVLLPDNISDIGSYAFANCTSLKKIIIPKHVNRIGRFAFENCNSIKTVLLPEYLYTIFEYAFSGCPAISDVYYNGSEQNSEFIDIYAFNDDLKNAEWHCNYPIYTPGDIDHDGEQTNQDLIRLFQYLSGWDVDVSVPTLDIDCDGVATNQDLIRLFQHLSGWNVDIF